MFKKSHTFSLHLDLKFTLQGCAAELWMSAHDVGHHKPEETDLCPPVEPLSHQQGTNAAGPSPSLLLEAGTVKLSTQML